MHVAYKSIHRQDTHTQNKKSVFEARGWWVWNTEETEVKLRGTLSGQDGEQGTDVWLYMQRPKEQWMEVAPSARTRCFGER